MKREVHTIGLFVCCLTLALSGTSQEETKKPNMISSSPCFPIAFFFFFLVYEYMNNTLYTGLMTFFDLHSNH